MRYQFQLNKLIISSPLTKTSPANEFWGINQAITYGSTSILSSTAGIVDTGRCSEFSS